jgi:hypothetical protein
MFCGCTSVPRLAGTAATGAVSAQSVPQFTPLQHTESTKPSRSKSPSCVMSFEKVVGSQSSSCVGLSRIPIEVLYGHTSVFPG